MQPQVAQKPAKDLLPSSSLPNPLPISSTQLPNSQHSNINPKRSIQTPSTLFFLFFSLKSPQISFLLFPFLNPDCWVESFHICKLITEIQTLKTKRHNLAVRIS